MKNKKDLVFEKYNVKTEEELYDKLLDINHIVENEQKKNKNEKNILSPINYSDIPITSILILIGLGFLSSFILLVFENGFILSLLLVILYLIFVNIKSLNSISSLFLIPIPIVLAISLGEYNLIIENIMFVAIYGFLLHKHKDSSLFMSLLAISSCIYVAIDEYNSFGLITLIIIHLGLFLFTWFKTNKYIVSSIYYILTTILIINLNYEFEFEYLNSIVGTAVLILFILFLKKDTETNIDNQLIEYIRDIGLVVISITLFIYTLSAFDSLDDEGILGLLITTIIISLYTLWYRRNNWLIYQFSIFNILILLPYYINVFLDINELFFVTLLSIVFYVCILIYQKKFNIEKSYYIFYSYAYIIYIFVKILVIDLSSIDFFIRLSILLILSLIFIGYAIFKIIKKNMK